MDVLVERFISRERNEPPDIDVDFEHERREEVIQYIYKQFLPIIPMSEIIWKCFRCNLTFKNEEMAEIHKQITKHSVSKEKTIFAMRN